MRKSVCYIYLIAAGIFWGLLGVFSRSLSNAGLTAGNVTCVRVMGSFLILALYCAVKDRNAFHIQWKHLPIFAGIGILGMLACTLAYTLCLETCSIAVGGILLYTSPAFVIVMSYILWKEPITKHKVIALLLTLIGCILVSGASGDNLSGTWTGILLGLVSGFTYALQSIFSHYGIDNYSPNTVTLWTFLTASVGGLFFLNPANMAASFTALSTGVMSLCVILIGTLLPTLFFEKGLTGVETSKASIITCLEPAIAVLSGVIVFQEIITFPMILGLLCILISIYILR